MSEFGCQLHQSQSLSTAIQSCSSYCNSRADSKRVLSAYLLKNTLNPFALIPNSKPGLSMHRGRHSHICFAHSIQQETTRVLQPLFLASLINYFTPESEVTKTQVFLYAGGVSLCAMVMSIIHHPYFFRVQRIGMKMRVACCSLLYRKVSSNTTRPLLKLSLKKTYLKWSD